MPLPSDGPRTGRRTRTPTSGLRATYSQSAHEKGRRAPRRQPRSVSAFTLFPPGRAGAARNRRPPPAHPGLPRHHVLGRPAERPSFRGRAWMPGERSRRPGGRIETAICDRGIPEPRRPVAERAGAPMPSGGGAGQDPAAGALGAAGRDPQGAVQPSGRDTSRRRWGRRATRRVIEGRPRERPRPPTHAGRRPGTSEGRIAVAMRRDERRSGGARPASRHSTRFVRYFS